MNTRMNDKKVKDLKVKDTVYQVDEGGRVYAEEIIGIYSANNLQIYQTRGIDFDERAIGTSVFVTAEDAKQYYEKHYGGNHGR